MHHSIPFRLLVLVFISTVSPLPGLDIGSYSADNIPISALASEEQIFGPIVSTEYPEPSIGLDTLNDCVGPAADNLDLFSSDYTLQARQSICPNPSSADEEHREDSNSNTSSPPSAGIFDLDLFDNSIDPDPSPDPPRRIFSLPQDYQDQRCKEFGIIQYAVCSSGDYRDEEKSVAYAFHPVRTYRLKRCTFSEFPVYSLSRSEFFYFLSFKMMDPQKGVFAKFKCTF